MLIFVIMLRCITLLKNPQIRRLGFAPRSKSFAIEPSVLACSISSLSEFCFTQYVRKSTVPNHQTDCPFAAGLPNLTAIKIILIISS